MALPIPSLLVLPLLMHVAMTLGAAPGHDEFLKRTALVGIMSERAHFSTRQLARSTYMHQSKPGTSIDFKFVIGCAGASAGDLASMKMEGAIFKDMLLLANTTDESSGDKILDFFSWATEQKDKAGKSYDYIVKASEHVYIHAFNLQQLMMSLPDSGAYWGNAHFEGTFNVKDYVGGAGTDEKMDSAYMSAGMYVLGADIAKWMGDNKEKLNSQARICLKGTCGDSFEDRQVGWWVAIAITALGGTQLTDSNGKINYKDIKPLDRSTVFPATNAEWYERVEGGTADGELSNPDAQAGVPPLSTVAVHNLKSAGDVHKLHEYFMTKSLFQWSLCTRLEFKPEVCGVLLSGGSGWVSEQPAFMARLYLENKEKGYWKEHITRAHVGL